MKIKQIRTKNLEKMSNRMKISGCLATRAVKRSGMTKAMITGWYAIPVVISSTCNAQELIMKLSITGHRFGEYVI